MTRLLLAAPLLLAAGCTTAPTPYAPVANVRYSAMGQNPFWLLNVGDDRIVLRVAGTGDETAWPRTLPVVDGNVTSWRFRAGEQAVLIEARQALPTPCELGNRRYEDFVRVTIGDQHYDGCGGQLFRERESR